MKNYLTYSLLLIFSMNTFAIDLACDKVNLDDDGNSVPDTKVEEFHVFKNLIPDQNQTFLDGDVKVTINWDNDKVTILREAQTFYFISQAIISRKDFSWTGSTLASWGATDHKGNCKIWEKPTDNVF